MLWRARPWSRLRSPLERPQAHWHPVGEFQSRADAAERMLRLREATRRLADQMMELAAPPEAFANGPVWTMHQMQVFRRELLAMAVIVQQHEDRRSLHPAHEATLMVQGPGQRAL
jgi:hypothetical protein